MNKYTKGFSLVELMIAVAIVAILASIAYPSYMNSVRKSNRTEAKTELFDIAQRLQKCFTTYGRFNDPNNQDLCPVFERLTSAPTYKTRDRELYEITLSDNPAVTATTYTLKATAIAAPQLDDTGCEELTLDHMGQTLPEDCW